MYIFSTNLYAISDLLLKTKPSIFSHDHLTPSILQKIEPPCFVMELQAFFVIEMGPMFRKPFKRF